MQKKWLIGIFVIVPLLIALILVGLTKNCRRSGSHPKLEIVRNGSGPATQAIASEVVLENGLIKEIFRVSPTTFLPRDESPAAADPFAEAAHPSLFKHEDPKKILEQAGITFGKGTSVIYNPITLELTAVNTREQLDLIDAYLESTLCFPEMQIAIRAEIYEMPSLTALDVLESAAPEGDHTAERNAVRKAVGQGGIRLVNATSIIARSGQRAKIEDSYDFPLPLSKTSSNEKEDENGDKPDWEIRQVGTLFEVDPVLGSDNFTIDLNFSLEHHTAPPEQSRTNSRSKRDYPPTLHPKKLTTQITLQDGSYILVGSWKPTGKPEYEKNDLMDVIFVTATIQKQISPVSISEKTSGKK